VFVFDLPPHAEIVTCGLFVCVPEFGTTSTGEDGDAIQLVNADRCLRSVTSFPVALDRPDDTQVEFSLDELQEYGTRTEVPMLLATGCWAASGSALIGASELQRLAPSEVPLTQGIAPKRQNACGREASPCVLDEDVALCGHDRCRAAADPASITALVPRLVESCSAPGENRDGLTCSRATVPLSSACDAGATCPILDDCDGGLCRRERATDTFGVCLDGDCRVPCLSDADCAPPVGVNLRCVTDDSDRTGRWLRSTQFGVCEERDGD
jgi:hypothetical protein